MALYRLSNIRLNSVRLSREGSSILPPIIFHSRYLQYKYSINTSKNEKSTFLFEPELTNSQITFIVTTIHAVIELRMLQFPIILTIL